ncbi:MAG: FAD-dependent monooxygenase [Nanobdellota archaeon]
MRYIIIGAGPAGCHAAKLLAERGNEVTIFEEHEEIGKPIQCTGLITSSKDLKLPESVIANRISKVIVESGNEREEFRLRNKETVLHRDKFDKLMAGRAEKAGARIKKGYKFQGINKGKAIINEEEYGFDYLIGADGANSSVRRYLNPEGIKKVFGYQDIEKGKTERDVFRVALGKGKFFSWEVPEAAGKIRQGAIGRKKTESAGRNTQAGMIPVYDKDLVVKKGQLMLVGDAAGHVKASTGGGILPGLEGAEEVISSGRDMLRNKDLELHRQLKRHKFIRNILDRFDDRDYEKLVKLAGNVKHILEEEDREKADFIMKVILREPGFLGFAGKILPILHKIYK